MSRLASCVLVLAATMIVAVGLPVRAETIIQFDYSYDTGNFFGPGTPARATLEAAGAFFEGVLADELSAIAPGGVNSWNAEFVNPSTGDPVSLPNTTIPANTLVVYAGARNLPDSSLGKGGPGGFSANGTPAWLNTVGSRGEGTTSGPGANDFAPWGGTLSVDNDATWNFEHTVAPGSGQSDLFSVVLHELGHVLGYGTSDSWDNLVSGLDFTGPAAEAEYSGAVPLDEDLAHWAADTMSQVYPDGAGQEAAMDPQLTEGTRKQFTDLDVAALGDIGWDLVPEPSTLALALMGLVAVLAYCWRRRFAG